MGRSKKVWCIFCREFKPRGREHAWSDWIGREAKARKGRGTVTTYRMNDAGVLVPFGSKTDIAYTTRVPEVCQACNHDWMGDIENAVAPFLKPVIFDGVSRDLTLEERRWFGAWLYLRTLVLQCVAMRHELPRAYCDAMFEAKSQAPETSRVWAGLVDMEHLDNSHFGSAPLLMPPEIADGSHGEPFVAALTVGHLVGRVFMYPKSLRGNPKLEGANNGAFDSFLASVEPGDDQFAWPIRRLDFAGYLRLARASPLFPQPISRFGPNS